MHAELTAETQAAVDTLIESGAYDSAEHVLKIAVENLLRDEPDHVRVRKLIQEGIDALEKGISSRGNKCCNGSTSAGANGRDFLCTIGSS